MPFERIDLGWAKEKIYMGYVEKELRCQLKMNKSVFG